MTHLLTFLAFSLVGILIWLLVDPDPAYSLRRLARENGVDLAAWWREVRGAFGSECRAGRWD